MAKKKKVPYRICQSDACRSYVSAKTEVEYTTSGIPYGLTLEGAEYMTRNQANYGELCHRIICEGLQEKSLLHPERMEDFIRDVKTQYGLPSRLYNTAVVEAEGQIASVQECHTTDVDTKKAKLFRAVQKLLKFIETPKAWKGWELKDCLHVLERKVENTQRKFTAVIREGISYFPGRKVYEKQHLLDKQEFRDAYRKRRTGRMACFGVAGERDGNSELNAQFSLITKSGKYVFDIVKNGANPVVLWKIKVGKKEGLRLFLRLQEQKVLGSKVAISVSCFPTDKHDFETRVVWMEPMAKPYDVGSVFLSLDTNGDNLKWALFEIKDGVLTVKEHGTMSWNPKQRANIRDNQFHIDLNDFVEKAKSHQATIVLENLDFEGGKQMDNALGQLLHTMPYVKIRDMFVRKCNHQGVPMRVVNAQYTSLLGNLLADLLPGLDRDQLAAVVIGLKASPAGVLYLEKLSTELLQQDKFILRFNIKGKTGCHVQVQKATFAARGNARVSVSGGGPAPAGTLGVNIVDRGGFLGATRWMCELVGSLNEKIGNLLYLSKGKAEVPRIWLYTLGPPLGLTPLKLSRGSSGVELVPVGDNVQHCPGII